MKKLGLILAIFWVVVLVGVLFSGLFPHSAVNLAAKVPQWMWLPIKFFLVLLILISLATGIVLISRRGMKLK